MQTSDIIALFAFVVAGYGAILSTFLAVREFRTDRRRVRVKWDMELEFISVKAINVGHRPVEIINAGLDTTYGGKIIVGKIIGGKTYRGGGFAEASESPLPKKLEDGESMSVIFDRTKAREALEASRKRGRYPRKTVFYTSVFVEDAEGHVYRSRFPYDFIN